VQCSKVLNGIDEGVIPQLVKLKFHRFFINKTIPGKVDYNTYRGWTQIDYQNKHYNVKQRDKAT